MQYFLLSTQVVAQWPRVGRHLCVPHRRCSFHPWLHPDSSHRPSPHSAGSAPMPFTAALHTYYTVSDIANVSVEGLKVRGGVVQRAGGGGGVVDTSPN